MPAPTEFGLSSALAGSEKARHRRSGRKFTRDFRSEIPQYYDQYYLTLAQGTNAGFTGPILCQNTDSDCAVPASNRMNQKEYVNAVFKLIVEVAEQIAAEFGFYQLDPQLYSSAILASILIPLHESQFNHFRELMKVGSFCQPDLNSGRALLSNGDKELLDKIGLRGLREKKSRSRYILFHDYFKGGKRGQTAAVPGCDQIDSSSPATQLIGSGDYQSQGLFQIAFASHIDNYISVGGWKSVRKTIEYGVRHIMTGMQYVHMNAYNAKAKENLSCIRGKSGINYEGLIRGTWSGYYNSGNYSRTCRYQSGKDGRDDEIYGQLKDLLSSPGAETTKIHFIHELLEPTQAAVLAKYVQGVKGSAVAPEAKVKPPKIQPPSKPNPPVTQNTQPAPSITQEEVHPKRDPFVSSSSDETPASGWGVVYRLAKRGKLRLRVAPGLRSSVLDLLPRGTELEKLAVIRGDSITWFKVRVPTRSNRVGWVSSKYIKSIVKSEK